MFFLFPDEDVKKIMKTTKNWKMLLVSEFNRHRQYFSIFYFSMQTFMFNRWTKRERCNFYDVLIKSKILERLDLSDDFWERSGVQNKSLKNKLVYMK